MKIISYQISLQIMPPYFPPPSPSLQFPQLFKMVTKQQPVPFVSFSELALDFCYT